ncbi:MAG: hypothetical protein ACREHG_03550 [Candidatus Saccharimonadales bacterium]
MMEEATFEDFIKPERASRNPKKPSTSESLIEHISVTANSETQEKTVGYSKDEINILAGAFSLIIIGLTVAISRQISQSSDYAMESDQAEEIGRAASRLILRRLKIKKSKRGDLTDGLAIIAGFSAYGMHIYNVWRERTDEREAKTSDNNQAPERVNFSR